MGKKATTDGQQWAVFEDSDEIGFTESTSSSTTSSLTASSVPLFKEPSIFTRSTHNAAKDSIFHGSITGLNSSIQFNLPTQPHQTFIHDTFRRLPRFKTASQTMQQNNLTATNPDGSDGDGVNNNTGRDLPDDVFPTQEDGTDHLTGFCNLEFKNPEVERNFLMWHQSVFEHIGRKE